MSEKEKTIQNYMKSLDLTREEAEQLWADDNEDFIGEEGEKMTQKAKKNGRRYEQSTKKRKPSTKERKVDEAKKVLVNDLREMLDTLGCEMKWQLSETELNFNYLGDNYTFKLTKHRTPKTIPNKKDVVEF